MTKTSKTMAVAAIMLISCIASVCVIPVNDAASELQDYKDVEYWGFEDEIDSIDDIIPLFSEMIPGDIEITDVGDFEKILKNLASSAGFNADDVTLYFDVEASTHVLGHKFEDNGIFIKAGSGATIPLLIEVPREFVRMLADGDEYVPTGFDDIIIFDIVIEIERNSKTMVQLNEKGEVMSSGTIDERIIHLEGNTNLSVDGDEVVYLPEATNKVDQVISNVLMAQTHFVSGGFKFMPSDENDNSWKIDDTAHIKRIGTVHNALAGVSADIFELADRVMDLDLGEMIINPEDVSGIVINEVGTKDFDITATVDRTGELPVVSFTNNAPSDDTAFRFFNPFGFLFNDPAVDLSKMINENMILDEDGVKTMQENINEHIDACDEHTKDMDVKVFFIENEENYAEQTPLETKTVNYGESVDLDVEAPEKEGLIHIGWEMVNSKEVVRDSTSPVYCDLYLVPSYAKEIDAAPTSQDFDNTEYPLAWIVNMGDEVVVNADLIKEHKTHMYVIGKNGDVFQYLWKVSGYGIDGTIGNLDLTIKVADAPSYAADEIEGKEYIYLDANLVDKVPMMTSLNFKVGDKFEDQTFVDIYVDNGTGLELAGTHMVQKGYVHIHAENATGFLVVGGSSEPTPEPTPEPSKDKSGNNNTMLIIGAVIAVIIVAAIAVFLMKRNA